jgi:hypothetical protein
MKKKLKPSKPTTDLVWVDIARTSSPSDAIAYGFMSPDLVPIVNNLLTQHSVVIGGTCYEHQYKEELLGNTTKWEEVST